MYDLRISQIPVRLSKPVRFSRSLYEPLKPSRSLYCEPLETSRSLKRLYGPLKRSMSLKETLGAFSRDL